MLSLNGDPTTEFVIQFRKLKGIGFHYLIAAFKFDCNTNSDTSRSWLDIIVMTVLSDKKVVYSIGLQMPQNEKSNDCSCRICFISMNHASHQFFPTYLPPNRWEELFMSNSNKKKNWLALVRMLHVLSLIFHDKP